jgi:hypothetical protein
MAFIAAPSLLRDEGQHHPGPFCYTNVNIALEFDGAIEIDIGGAAANTIEHWQSRRFNIIVSFDGRVAPVSLNRRDDLQLQLEQYRWCRPAGCGGCLK